MSADARNLLFISSDQHARRVAGCYGDGIVATPNLDRIAAEGVAFDAAYCPSPICTPSRMAMLTARRPHRQSCWTNDDALDPAIPTWPHALGAAGKRPALIGRLHALGPDQLHGYAERQVGEHSPNWPGVARHDLGPLAGANDPDPRALSASGAGFCAYQAKDEAVTQAAVAWLRDVAPERAAADGFALTVGYMLPHPPYVAEPEAFARYAGRVPPPRLAPPAQEHPFHAWWRRDRGIAEVEPDAAARARAAYWALVDRLDAMIGRLLAALEQTGLLDDTLVVYASDHGDHLGERGLWWKHSFFEESVAVPLLMRLPGVLPAGERRGRVVDLCDLAMTMLEALGAPAPPGADGRSFWRVARDGGAPWIDEAFSEYCTDAVPDWTGGRAVRQRMIRSGRWKLVFYDGEPPQLFDLEADPDEAEDLAGAPAAAAIRETLLRRVLDGWNPDDIRRRMEARRREKDLIGRWARAVRPPDAHLWSVDPAVNRLHRP